MRAPTKTHSIKNHRTGYGKLSCNGVPYPAPRSDYSEFRLAKLKCERCVRSELGACNLNPLTCKRFEPDTRPVLNEYAWDREGEGLQGGFHQRVDYSPRLERY